MSADNWAICPNCLKKAEADLKSLQDDLNGLYGKIPPAEYMERHATMPKEVEGENHRTFREDYELGVYTGQFTVNYHGHCSACGLKHEFNITQALGEPPKQSPVQRRPRS